MQFTVAPLNKIDPQGLELLPREQYTLDPDHGSPDGILVRSAVLSDLPESVLAVARAGIGTNNIPSDELAQAGVPVFNTPGANANAVKELTLVGLGMAARNIAEAIRFVDQVESMTTIESAKSRFKGRELFGSRLGIIGLGAIGSSVAQGAIDMGMSVIGYDPAISVDAAWRIPARVERAHDLDQVIRDADFVTLHIPLLDSTRDLISDRELGLMRQGATLINFSRKEVVNTDAVLRGLDNNLHSFVTDFPTEEMQGHEQVIGLPHLGASTEQSETNCAIMAVRELRDYLENGNIYNSVNYPNLTLERGSDWRVTVAHDNVPGVVADLSGLMSDAGINITDMANSSRDSVAYTIFDLDAEPDQKLIEDVERRETVRKVRYLS